MSENAVLLGKIETGSSGKKSWVTRTFSFVRKDIMKNKQSRFQVLFPTGFASTMWFMAVFC